MIRVGYLAGADGVEYGCGVGNEIANVIGKSYSLAIVRSDRDTVVAFTKMESCVRGLS